MTEHDGGLWERVRATNFGDGSASQRLVLAVLDLDARLARLENSFEELRDREGFNARLEALQAARQQLQGLPSEQPNARGYRDSALKPSERVDMELRIARFLLGGP